MASELYMAKSRLETMSKQEGFDTKTKNAFAIGAVALGIIDRLGDLNELIRKDKLTPENS